MHHTLNRKTALLGATAIVSAVLLQAPASAQETAESETGEFLGTLTLGESKRDVQTDTATPVTVVDQEEIEDRQAGTGSEGLFAQPMISSARYRPACSPPAMGRRGRACAGACR